MQLSLRDGKDFVVLHQALMWYVNQVLDVVPQDGLLPVALADRPTLRMAFAENPGLLLDFIDENPLKFSRGKLAILQSWKDFVFDYFLIVEFRPKHAVFMTFQQEPVIYGVLAPTQPIYELVLEPLPVLVETMLLPYKGTIVYDGCLHVHNVSFGDSYLMEFDRLQASAIEEFGIVASIPAPSVKQRGRQATRAKRPGKKRQR